MEGTKDVLFAFGCPGLCAGKDGETVLTALLKGAFGHGGKMGNVSPSHSCSARLVFQAPAFVSFPVCLETTSKESLGSCQVNAALKVRLLCVWSRQSGQN